MLASQSNLCDLSLVLTRLKQASILNQENFDKVLASQSNLHDLAEALALLQECQDKKLLTQESFAVVVTDNTPLALAEALTLLDDDLFTHENLAAVKNHSNPLSLARALRYLHYHGGVTSFTFLFISSQPDPFENIDKFTKTYKKTNHTYGEIYSAVSGAHTNIDQELQQAYALLLDYTKGKRGLINSPLAFFESVAAKCKRGFSGHMNRHHIDAVAEILDRIRNNQITSLSELREPLRAIQQIPGFNQLGSLAKRIHFIYPTEKQEAVVRNQEEHDRPAP